MLEDNVGMYTLLENQDTNKHNFAGGNMGLCFTFTGLVDENRHTHTHLNTQSGGCNMGWGEDKVRRESESQGKENLAL